MPPAVRLLAIARAVNQLGAFTLPFLAVVLTVELGASLPVASLVLALFGVATIPSRLVGGQLADRLGRKRTIVIGLVGCAIAQILIALAPDLWSAVAAVALLGLMFEIYEPPSQAVVADLTQPANRPAAYILLGAVMGTAAVAAGLLASLVSHWNLRWLFAIDAATCLACAALIAAALPRHARPPKTEPEPVPEVGGSPWRDHRLLILLATGTAFAILYLQLTATLPLTLLQRDLPASSAGIVLSASAITLVVGQRLLRARMLRGLDTFRAMTLGYALLGAGLLANGFARSLSSFVGAAALWSMGQLILLGHTQAIVASVAPEHLRARYLAAYGVSWGVAGTIAPLLGIQLLAASGPATLWTACALTAATLALLQPTIRRQLTQIAQSGRSTSGSRTRPAA
jgi:MFS family permease